MYGLVLSPGFLRATKNALFLNLLYRSLKRCEAATAAALAKRVLQSALLMPANMAAALLVVVSAAMAERGGLPREQIDGLEEIPAEIAVEGGLEEEKKEKMEEESEKASEDEDEDEEEVDNDKIDKEGEEGEDEDEVKNLDDSFFSSDASDNESDNESDAESPKEPEEPKEPKEPEAVEATEEKKEETPTQPAVRYNLSARDPAFSGADKTLFFELTLLTRHYHPTVAAFARRLLAGETIACASDPLADFSNKAFLDKFAYKHAKKRDIENARDRGAQALQPKKRGALAAPVNSEEFLRQREEDVAVEDKFFYQFFKEQARRHPKKKKETRDDAEEEAAMDAFAEGLAEDMMEHRVGEEDEDVDEDFGDLQEQFEDEENGHFLQEGEEAPSDEDEDEEEEEEEEEGDDGRMVLDEGDNGSRKKTQDHKKKMKSLYASAEEFEAMLAEAAQAREEMEKKRQQKRGNRGGRGGRGGKRGGFRGKRRRWSVCCNKQERLPSSYGKTSSVASRSIHEFDNKTPTTSICDRSLTLIFKSQYWWFSGTMLPTSMFRYCSSAREKSPRRREERMETRDWMTDSGM